MLVIEGLVMRSLRRWHSESSPPTKERWSKAKERVETGLA